MDYTYYDLEILNHLWFLLLLLDHSSSYVIYNETLQMKIPSRQIALLQHNVT